MALTQTDLDNLDRAIASSELEVQFSDGQRVKYRSMDELLKARAHVVETIASTTRQQRSSFRFNFTTQRGG